MKKILFYCLIPFLANFSLFAAEIFESGDTSYSFESGARGLLIKMQTGLEGGKPVTESPGEMASFSGFAGEEDPGTEPSKIKGESSREMSVFFGKFVLDFIKDSGYGRSISFTGLGAKKGVKPHTVIATPTEPGLMLKLVKKMGMFGDSGKTYKAYFFNEQELITKKNVVSVPRTDEPAVLAICWFGIKFQLKPEKDSLGDQIEITHILAGQEWAQLQ